MKSLEIRKKFFQFFEQRGHAHVPSSSLIPAEDPTLLFANAGMNQFKDVFLGKEQRSYKRAVSIQKCIRAGGKHNDLDNVGFTARHLTFFEMMGNFSFGDYFKKDAIRYAWDFLTQEVKLPADKLYATVFTADDEAYDIWHKEIGLPKERIFRLGAKDNFWQMGDVGPCGPCSEIYVDRGPEEGCGKETCAPGCSCDRFMEIWNNVFMQFDRQKNAAGQFFDTPLKQTGVDTGMGLERLMMIIGQQDSVFDTDLFSSIIKAIEEHTGHSYKNSKPDIKGAFRVLADHIRSTSFALADGCTPSNEGRGYVVRKIIRRAALFAQKLSDKNFFPLLVKPLVADMGSLYPELKKQETKITTLLTNEIDKFSQNLQQGQLILEKYFAESKADKKITGLQAFKLYDTYGFPLELTGVIARERGYSVDEVVFEEEMEKQRTQSGKKETTGQHQETLPDTLITQFTGYAEEETISRITALLCGSSRVEEAPSGEKCWIITEKSPFYIECGGQISDTGWVVINDMKVPVLGLKKINKAIAVEVKMPDTLRVGAEITLIVNSAERWRTRKNHTATHLLQAALMRIVGSEVKQAGSLVAPDYMRFDFSYHENLTPQQIKEVEDLVNQKIMENIPLKIATTTYKDAISRGVIAFFGEKYNPESVRVVEIPGFSAELCGGTHVTATGDIGCFKITEITSLSAGVKRLVAVTGPAAVHLFQNTFTTVKNLSHEFKVQPEQIEDAIAKQKEQIRTSQTQIKQLKKKLFALQIPQLISQIKDIQNLPVCIFEHETEPADLREAVTVLMQKKPAFYILMTNTDNRCHMLASISPQFAQTLDLKILAQSLKEQGFVGGGSATMIQGSFGSCDEALKKKIEVWLSQNIKQ